MFVNSVILFFQDQNILRSQCGNVCTIWGCLHCFRLAGGTCFWASWY